MSGNAHSFALQQLARVVDQPLIQNSFRGIYVEFIVSYLLGDEWVSTDNWSAYDFIHQDGTKLEVKQSAALQSWSLTSNAKTSSVSFSIRAAKEHWVEDRYETMFGRVADIYVFAHHGETDPDIADHREIEQWQFYPILESKLPESQNSISLGPLRRLADPVVGVDLKREVDDLRMTTRKSLS